MTTDVPARSAGTSVSARRATAAALAVGLAVSVFADGGFGATSRAAFAAIAGAALLLALLADADRALAACRRVPVLALAALAVAAALSAAWTVGDPVRALRWSLVIAGYGAIAVAAATVASNRDGVRFLALALALTAGVAGVLGIAGVALRSSPMALHMNGEWQAAGPFEYPPALALAELTAIPILLTAMVKARPLVAGIAAGGLGIAVVATLLASGRVALALAAILLAATILGADLLQSSRAAIASAWGVAVVPAATLLALGDPADPASPLSGDAGRALALAAVVAVSALAWPSVRASVRAQAATRVRPRVQVALVAIIVVAGVAIASSVRSGHGVEASSGWTHGRIDHWQAASATVIDHPVLGVGADAYFRGSREEQGADPVLYAHSLPLELGAELGLLGLAAALVLYVSTARAAWRARRDPLLLMFAPGAILFLAVNLVDWPWHLAGAGAIWAVALGAVLASTR